MILRRVGWPKQNPLRASAGVLAKELVVKRISPCTSVRCPCLCGKYPETNQPQRHWEPQSLFSRQTPKRALRRSAHRAH